MPKYIVTTLLDYREEAFRSTWLSFNNYVWIWIADFQTMTGFQPAIGTDITGQEMSGMIIQNLMKQAVTSVPTLTQMYAGVPFDYPSDVLGPGWQLDISGVGAGDGRSFWMFNQGSNGIFWSNLARVSLNTHKVTALWENYPGWGGIFGTSFTATPTPSGTVLLHGNRALDGDGMAMIGDGPPNPYDPYGYGRFIFPGRTLHSDAEFWTICAEGGGSGRISIQQWTASPANGVNYADRFEIDVSPLFPPTAVGVVGGAFDQVHGCLILMVENVAYGSPYIMSINPSPLSLNWITPPIPTGADGWLGRLMNNPTLLYGTQDNFFMIDTGSGEIKFDGQRAGYPNDPDLPVLAFVGSFYRLYDGMNQYLFTYSLAVANVRIALIQVPRQAPLDEYKQFLTCCNRAIMGHLYQITSQAGESDYFTDLDLDINYGGQRWKANSLRFEGLRRKLGLGMSVDEQQLKVWAGPEDTLFGANFLTGAEGGLLDGATIVRRRIVWEFITGNVQRDIQFDPLFVFTLFTGFTSQIVKGGASHVEFKVKSALVKLNVNMPRNYYQPNCLWTLYDKGCTLIKDRYRQNGTVSNATYNTVSPAGGTNQPNGADGIPNYQGGRLLFTSGVCDGQLVLIDTNDPNVLRLAYPLDTTPNVGDTFQYWPGCSKSYSTCQVKFNNQQHFRGFDKVPPVMVSI